MNNDSDDDFIVNSEITPEDEIFSLENQLKSLEEDYESLKKINALNAGALKLLIQKCKDGGFNPFPDIKLVPFMTKEELLERNKQVKTNRVSSDEVAKFPTEEELYKMYSPSAESEKFIDMILSLPKK